MPSSVDVPDIVRRKALVHGAEAWLSNLPSLVADLEQKWRIRIGRGYDGGTEAFVAEATLEDGSEAVLKLLVPRADNDPGREIEVLRLADGDGCARLLNGDAARSALLLERLGPSMYELGLPVAHRHEALCRTAERLWRHSPDCELPTGAEKGHRLVGQIGAMWEELGHPCSERTVAHALSCAERRIAAHDDERAVLVHGDIHQWNALKANDGFKLVDPDGLLAEAEYDLGVLMREDPVELARESDPHVRSRRLAQLTGLDEIAIWEWGVVERVSTGLVATRIGLQPEASQMLALADQLSDRLAD